MTYIANDSLSWPDLQHGTVDLRSVCKRMLNKNEVLHRYLVNSYVGKHHKTLHSRSLPWLEACAVPVLHLLLLLIP